MSDDSKETQIMSRDDIRTSAIASGAVLRQRYRLDSEIGRGGMSEAADHLARYTEFVAGCQSPRFKREAVRLTGLLQN